MNKFADNNKGKPFWIRVAINILLMIVAACLILWISTFVLDYWTRHGKNVKVPDVKGMHYDQACDLLTAQDFEVVLQDSVYEKGIAPGTVVEQNPKDSVEVKPGRTIYLTINAFYPQTVMLPTITDISLRQARTILEGLGIKNIDVKQVPSDYPDLVLAAIYQGKRVHPGVRVPLTARITLEVGASSAYGIVNADTLGTANNAVDPNELPDQTGVSIEQSTVHDPTTTIYEPEIDPELFD